MERHQNLNHFSTFFSKLSYLKNNSQFPCDVTLFFDGEEFHAHKLILSCSSLYFRAIFNGKFVESNSKRFEMNGFDREILLKVLHYIYSREIPYADEDISEISKAANYLQIKSLVDACDEHMKRNMKSKYCIAWWKLAETHPLNGVQQSALNHISCNLEEVTRTPEFLELETAEVKRLFTDRDSTIQHIRLSQELLFAAIMDWVHHDPNERKQHMGNLLELIKTDSISSSFLNTTILKENLLREDIGGAKWLLANFSLQQSYNPFRREPIELYPDAEQPNFVIMDRTNRCLGFNTETKRLFNLANHPRAQGYCAVSYKEDVYLFGGKRTRTALRYSVGTNNWETIPFRCYFTMHSGVVANDSAYFTGGYSSFHRVWQNLVCRYDFHLAKMTQGSTMLMRRASHGSAVCDDCLYVCGGSNRTVDSIMELALSERMDIREGMWRLLPHMKSTHGDCSSAVVNGNVYCSDTFGGKTERFDVRRYNWETLATAPGAMGSIVTYNEKLYRVHQSGIAVYDELEDSWSKVIEYHLDTPTVAVTNI